MTDDTEWRAARLAALAAEDGWLNLTDRVDIAPGRMTVGTAPDNDVVISSGPGHLGVLELDPDGQARFDGVAFAPVPDNPPRLKVGALLLEVSLLEGQYALRVRDTAAQLGLPVIDCFPLNPDWRIEAGWEALDAPETLGIDTVKGIATRVQLTHRARFVHDGVPVVLLVTHWKAGKPMFVFRDATSGKETYGAARFLIGEVSGDRVVLDFNRAFNPPCAFTEYAVCPLPPRQNILPFAVRAGEKTPA